MLEILGYGRALPEKIVTNEDLSKLVDTNDEWIVSRTGISSRYFADNINEKNMTLATASAKEAIAKAKISTEDIALCIVATFTPDYYTPSVSCMVSKGLGLREDTLCFDLNAACSGFLYSLHTARYLLEAYPGKYAVIIGSEVISKVLDMTDRNTCILFGDAAGAAVVKLNSEKDFAFVSGNRPDNDVLICDTIDAHVKMKGQDVFKFAVEAASSAIVQIMEQKNLTFDDVDYIVCHQANMRIIDAIARKFKLDKSKFYINLQKYGNTSAASIPLALYEMDEAGLLQKGSKIICSGFGAGLTYGAALLTV